MSGEENSMNNEGAPGTGEENPMSDADKHLDRLLDVNKHLTTLSAGALVLIGTFSKDIFPQANLDVLATGMLAMTFLGFFLSTLASVWAMIKISIYAVGDADKGWADGATYTVIAIIAFAIALGFFAFVVAAYVFGAGDIFGL
jgi:hypothetical protein